MKYSICEQYPLAAAWCNGGTQRLLLSGHAADERYICESSADVCLYALCETYAAEQAAKATSIQEEKIQEEDAAYLELLVGDVALSIGGGHGSHEQGAARQHSELQPGAVASLQLKGEHVVLVEGPAGHLVAVQGNSGAACIGNQQTEQ